MWIRGGDISSPKNIMPSFSMLSLPITAVTENHAIAVPSLESMKKIPYLCTLNFSKLTIMEEKDFCVGNRIQHEKYGEGIISENKELTFKVIFVRGGELEFSKMNASFAIVTPNENENQDSRPRLDVKEFERALTFILGKYNAIENRVALGKKWEGGTMILQPANPELKPKEIPVETFFHKIVMMRDRLRVLEQNINSSDSLTDEEKVNLQQYITRIYGTMTSFNILFDDKSDYFVGSKQ